MALATGSRLCLAYDSDYNLLVSARADLGAFLLWLVAFVLVFYAIFIGSGFIVPPNVSLVPQRGPIRLDI